MKSIKHLSAKIIFGILCLALLGCIVNFVKNLGGLVYSVIYNQPLTSVEGLPVLLHGDKQSAVHDISGSAIIYNSIGSLSLPKASFGLQLYLSIYELILTLSVGICLFIMIRIIWTVFKGDPFIPKNGKRIKLLAFIVIAVPLALQISVNYVTNKVLCTLIFSNLTISSEVMGRSTLTVCIFAGLLLFIISEVFRIGTSIKQEQELTI